MSDHPYEPTTPDPIDEPLASPEAPLSEPTPVTDPIPAAEPPLVGEPTASVGDPLDAASTGPTGTGPTSTGPTSSTDAGARERTPDLTPLYAVAGLTDVVLRRLRSTLAERSERLNRRAGELRLRRTSFTQDAVAEADALARDLSALPTRVRSLPEVTRVRLQELQHQADALLRQANATYTSLAGRGKVAVDGAVRSARDLSATTTRKVADAAEEQAEAAEEAAVSTPPTATVPPDRLDTDLTYADLDEVTSPPTGAVVPEPVAVDPVEVVPGSSSPTGAPYTVPEPVAPTPTVPDDEEHRPSAG